jgi:linoleoyl-CoA desaturase
MDSNSAPVFSTNDQMKFFRTLNSRVNNYFKENKISKNGNWKLHLKTIVMFSIFLVPYFLMISLEMPFWLYLVSNLVIGIGMSGVGMNVMHDGNHGSYSKNKWVNKFMGSSIYILAGNVYNWQVQHNVLHHTYTNIYGHDEDLDSGRIIRFAKEAKWFNFQKIQHYYSIFLYGLLTINWAITTDFKQMRSYMKRKLSFGKLPSPAVNWSVLVITKVIYFSFWIVLPLIFGIVWWKVILGFVVMHYTAGLILSVVFQLAHVVNETITITPNEKGEIENTWAIHQLFTTANFAPKNYIVNYFTGGLNHQIEHHIFPHISHIHYKKIGQIVKETAQEFNLPYIEYQSFRAALKSHFEILKKLGTNHNELAYH